MLHLDLGKAVKVVLRKKARVVAVQVPEGLKSRLTGIVREIEEKTGAKAFAFVDPCFGACDIADERAKALGADLLLHFGHGQFVAKHAVETVYLPLHYGLDEKLLHVLVEKLCERLMEKNAKSVALCSTAQFLSYLSLLQRQLGKRKIKAFIGKGRNVRQGQVLGCNYSSVKGAVQRADAVVFFGDGLFHPLGLAFCCRKTVFAADPLQGEVKEVGLEKELFLRKRIAMIEKARNAGGIAVWVSTKKGQQRMKEAMELREKIEENGKKAFVVVSDLLQPDYLLGVQVDAIACTACPRVALDDSSLFKKPVINPSELLIALREKKLGDYRFEELL